MSDSQTFHDWDDDHTALVHVLWGCKNDGLTLQDFDEVASRIRSSTWHAATQHRAAGGTMLCQNDLPAGHAHVNSSCLLPQPTAD